MTHAFLARLPRGVVPASELRERPLCAGDVWSLDALAGRFVEISGAALTATAKLILEVQRRGMFTAWIGDACSCFFPPDMAASGVDLPSLPVVRAPDALGAWRAADILIRSGGFALVIVDCGRDAEFPLNIQNRLAGLAKQHHAALVWIARRSRQCSPPSSLVSLRMEAERGLVGFDRFACELRTVKDKRAITGRTHREVCRGSDGLC